MASYTKAKRRDGSIRPGVFYARASVGSEERGNRRTRSKTFEGPGVNTRTIAKLVADWEAEVRAEMEGEEVEVEDDSDPAPPSAGPPTLDAVWRRYIRVHPEWSDAHRGNHDGHRAAVMLDGLGEKAITEVTDEDCAAHLLAFSKERAQGRKRGVSSIKQRRTFIKAVLGYGLKGTAIANPMEDVDAPRGRPQRVRKNVPDLTEADEAMRRGAEAYRATRRYAIDTSGHLIEDIATVILWTGLRRGEALGLQYGDLTKAGVLELERTVIRNKGKGGWEIQEWTKHDDDDPDENVGRAITASSIVTDLLARRRSVLDLERKLAGLGPAPDDAFVFAQDYGETPLVPDTVSGWWDKVRAEEPVLAPFPLKDLRHVFGTHLHALGLSVAAIAAHMGHSEEVSRKHYFSVRPKDADAVTAAIEEAVAERATM